MPSELTVGADNGCLISHKTKIIFYSKINHQHVRRFPLLHPHKALTALKMFYSTPRHGNLRLAQNSLDRRWARVSGLSGQTLAKGRTTV